MIKKENFFDREVYLKILEKRIGDLKEGYRQNIAIIGDELVGKTSIIFKFLNKFYDSRIIIIFLEIRTESLISFARRFIGVLLYNFLVYSGITMDENLDFLIRKSSKYIPKTIEKIKMILAALERKNINDIFTDLLSLCDEVNKETGKFSIIIFDEFHNLENMGIKNLYRQWSKLLILQKTTLYIVISSMRFKTKNILAKNLSLLFGNFELIVVEPFDIKTSNNYLNNRLNNINLEMGIKYFIVHFTGGYPLYLDIIIDELLKSDQNNLIDVLENTLFLPSGILNQRFSNYLKRFLDTPYSQDYISILYLISSGHNKLKDLAHILHRTKKEVSLRISHLLEIDAITRSADFLKINDPLFAYWLRFVYQEKLQSLTFDTKNQKALFRENIESTIQEFLSNEKKPIKERILELLHLFEDELIQIEKKRLRLSHFREIKFLEFNNRNLKDGIICRSHECLWIMAFKQDLLTDEDIAEFAKECKKYHHKLQKKIIVALQDIDDNARLRAMEEKILMWDLNNLNQILDLFYKPRIISSTLIMR